MIKVSVLVPTYNHSKYIAKCLESILAQKTSFHYEILVGEDGSTDGTREICRDFDKHYADKIKVFYNNRDNVIYFNGRPSGRRNLINLINEAKGEYIVICEGDDQFLDPFKLQKQVEFMEKNPRFSMVFHPVLIWNNYQNEVRLMAPMLRKKKYTWKDFVKKGNFMALNSVMFRAEALKPLPDWITQPPLGDISLYMIASISGDIGYLNDVMSLYRRHAGGIFSKSSLQIRKENTIKTWKIILQHLPYRINEKLLFKRINKSYTTYNIDLTPLKSDITDPIKLYTLAWKEFQDANYSKARFYMGQYRDLIDYEKFKITDFRNNKKSPTVSIICLIENLDVNKWIFKNINPQNFDTNFEFLVVNNSNTNVKVDSDYQNVELLIIDTPIKVSTSEAKNIGAFFARGEFLFFISEYITDYKLFLDEALKIMKVTKVIGCAAEFKEESDKHRGKFKFMIPNIPEKTDGMIIRRDYYQKFLGIDPFLVEHELIELAYLSFALLRKIHFIKIKNINLTVKDISNVKKHQNFKLADKYIMLKRKKYLLWYKLYNSIYFKVLLFFPLNIKIRFKLLFQTLSS